MVNLYVDGLDAQAFLRQTGLVLSLDKGGFVLSKRLSRLLRSQLAAGLFDAAKVNVQYMGQTPDEARV